MIPIGSLPGTATKWKQYTRPRWKPGNTDQRPLTLRILPGKLTAINTKTCATLIPGLCELLELKIEVAMTIPAIDATKSIMTVTNTIPGVRIFEVPEARRMFNGTTQLWVETFGRHKHIRPHRLVLVLCHLSTSPSIYQGIVPAPRALKLDDSENPEDYNLEY